MNTRTFAATALLTMLLAVAAVLLIAHGAEAGR